MTHVFVRVEQSYHQPGWRRSMEELQRVLDTQVSQVSRVLSMAFTVKGYINR